MLSNGLAFAAKESSIQNNLSVVLLIEWKKRRLLFVGDAEWEGEFKEGKHNGSWNVMWEKHREGAPEGAARLPEDRPSRQHQRHAAARRPSDPSEEGGSPTASTRSSTRSCRSRRRAKPTAQAIVSTEREFYNPIPECKLLVDLARRVSNTRSLRQRARRRRASTRRSIWATPKAKRNKFFETLREGVPGPAAAAAHRSGVRHRGSPVHRHRDSSGLTAGADR